MKSAVCLRPAFLRCFRPYGKAEEPTLGWDWVLLAITLIFCATLQGCGGGGGGGGGDVQPPAPRAVSGPAWLNFGRDAQHSAQGAIATQALGWVVWKTAVDLAPQYAASGALLIHYGSPVITSGNTVVVPVKTGATGGFRFEARTGASGASLWSADSDYVLPNHNWTPSFNIALTPANRVYAPGAAGKLFFRDDVDAAAGVTQTAVFYGTDVYASAKGIYDDGTSSPTVGPDGDVYYGVLESNAPAHNFRGWLLHFDSALSRAKTPGSFGWDDTASIVPASMVPSYTGTSTYLLATKYTNYGGTGTGDGKNRVAVLDPNQGQTDAISGISVMKEILTMLGPTPDPGYPGGVKEWCINTAAVDPLTRSILSNSEDGNLYRWNLATNQFTEQIKLNSGLAESYTPTVIGPDGLVYAINNAVLFSVGR